MRPIRLDPPGSRTPTGPHSHRDRRPSLDTPYFLTGSVRVHECPELAPILVRILAYQDVDFDVTIAEPGGGVVELTIDGARELDDDRMIRLEEQLQAFGPYAREAAVFRRHYGLDA